MLSSRLSFARFSLRILTLILPAVAYLIAVKVRFGFDLLFTRHNPFGLPSYWGIVLLTTIAWAILAEESGLWNLEQLYIPAGRSRRLLETLIITYTIVMAGGFFYRQVSYSRLVVAMSAVALFFLATILRILFRVFLDWTRMSGRSEVRVLIVGTGAYTRQVSDSIVRGQALRSVVVAYVHLPNHPIEVEGSPIIEWDEVASLSSNPQAIDYIVIALSHNEFHHIPDLLPVLERLCVPTRLAMDLAPSVAVRDQLIEVDGIRMLDLRPTPAESTSYLIYKRSLDVVFSMIVLSMAWPLFLLIALAIRWESQGPILFSQDRVGLNGKVFRILKFRTMRLGSQKEGDTRWTAENDPRRTRVGTLLRQTNLDELPQFFNVLRGEMSIVGPRPERPYFVGQFLREFEKYNSRHFLKAGITGWAQVNGWRGDTSIAKRVEYDLYYLKNWSLSFDLQIITLTCLRIFSSKNAY